MPLNGAIETRRLPRLPFGAGLPAAAMVVAGRAAHGDRTPPVNVTAASTVLVNGSTNGGTIAVPLDTTLTLELDENPSTGSSWILATTPGLDVAADGFVPGGASTPVVVATGLREIAGTFARPWENSTDGATACPAGVPVTPWSGPGRCGYHPPGPRESGPESLLTRFHQCRCR